MTPKESSHPLVVAVQPVLERLGGTVVDVSEMQDSDVPLVWDGAVIGAVRFGTDDLADALDRLIANVESELGALLAQMDRRNKQRAVRLLEQRGGFNLRKRVETVAARLGVTRFTVYNYLNNNQR